MRITIGTASELRATSRRDFLRLLGAGGTLLLLPGALAACGSDAATAPGTGRPGSGEPFVIDFSRGDVAVLQLALVLEQLEADFYSRVVDVFASSTFSLAEQAVLGDIRAHEVVHRGLLAAVLGADGAFTLAPTYGSLAFTTRADVLAAAKAIEDLGVATYNGVAQFVTTPDTLALLARIVSVEARHAAAVRDILEPRTAAFAPGAADDVFSPVTAATALQSRFVDKLGFRSLPPTFVQGPNGNG
jgi:rubrerythrin